MNRLPTPKEIALSAVASSPEIPEALKGAIATLIERTITVRDRMVCAAIQQELAATQQDLAGLRRAIEAMLYPKG